MSEQASTIQCTEGHPRYTTSMCDTQVKISELLHKIAAEQNIQNYELEIDPITTGGANYSSVLYIATIISNNENLHLFIKVAAMGAKMREQMPLKIYDTETFVYTDLKTAYRDLEDKHKVPEKHRLYLPAFYGAIATIPEILVIENLESKGFNTHDRMKSIDWDYATVAVVELVKLQSLSMAYRREYPEKYKYLADQYIMDWLNEESMEAFWTTGFQTTLSVIREENREKMKKFLDSIDLAMVKKMYAPLRCEVITHGDYRPSNLMHRRKDEQVHCDCYCTAGAEGGGNDFKITIFETERFVYKDLREAYKEIEERHQVPEKHRVYIAKYYGSDTTPPDEMLVLENLTVRGYVIHDRFKSIDWEYATVAVDELTKLHSLSMAFQREYPEKFKYFVENHQYEWLNEFTVSSLWEAGFKKAIAVAPEEHKKKLKKFFDQYDLEKITRQYDPLRVHVLTHGDYRPSNLMHKIRDDGSLEIIAVDHQTIQIGCPINDLLYLIFTGTDKQFRDQYFDKLIDYYYTQLSQAMLRLGIDPETTYSRADFDFEMKEKLPFGLSVAAFTLPIITVNSEDAPELKDMDLSSFAVQKTSALFPDRINGVVDDYVKWGILKD